MAFARFMLQFSSLGQLGQRYLPQPSADNADLGLNNSDFLLSLIQ